MNLSCKLCCCCCCKETTDVTRILRFDFILYARDLWKMSNRKVGSSFVTKQTMTLSDRGVNREVLVGFWLFGMFDRYVNGLFLI